MEIVEKSGKELVQESFAKVILMVEDGWDISKALINLKIDRGTFYYHISKLQKAELDMAKTLNTKYGVGSTSSKRSSR